METPKICPGCGIPLAPNGPQGLCPACLMKAGFPTGAATEATSQTSTRANRFTPPVPAELTQFFPQLEILEFIGQGGMGAVYKARQPALDRLVALKILPTQGADDPGFAERFVREARALARLNHPNIVAVYDFGHAGGFHFFVMELVDGANLRQVERAGKLAPSEALEIIPQICDALQYAHDAGVVHRDIKPENILLDKKGRVKIADFGLAKIFGTGSEPEALTEAGHVMGTPHYMAPEQVEHPLEVDHRADIYSLGVVFYEMLTGELPLGRFAAPSKKAAMDVRLDDVVLRTLEKEPAARYQQASAVKTAVETIAAGGGSGTPPPLAPASTAAPEESGPSHYSRTALVSAAWLAVALLSLAISWLIRQNVEAASPEVGEILQKGALSLQSSSLVGLWSDSIHINRYLFAPIGYSGLFGATILGWVALAQIRHSRGRLRGLGLAALVALLVPLLALDGIILALSYVAAFGQLGDGPNLFAIACYVTLALSLVVDGILVNGFWRMVNRPIGSLNFTPASQGPQVPVGYFQTYARFLLKAFIVTFLIIFSVSLIYGLNETPKYAAFASLRLFKNGLTETDTGIKAPDDAVIGPEEFNTQIRLMETRDIAAAVAGRMTNGEKDEFLLPFRSNYVQAPEMNLVDQLLANRFALPGRQSYIIQIGVMHPNPQLAAKVADYFAEEFINYNQRLNTQKEMKAVEELVQQSKVQTVKIEKIQDQINNLLDNYGAVELDPKNSILPAELQRANAFVVKAQSDLDLYQERWSQCQDYQANNKPLWTLSFIAADKQISALRANIDSLNTEIAGLSQTYGEQHPEIVQRRQRRETLQSALNDAVSNAVQTVYSDYQNARDRFNRAEGQLAQIQQEIHDTSLAQEKYDMLKTQKDAANAVLQQMLQTIQGQRSKIILGGISYQIVDHASGSVVLVEPKVLVWVFGSALGGILAAECLTTMLGTFFYMRWLGRQSAG